MKVIVSDSAIIIRPSCPPPLPAITIIDRTRPPNTNILNSSRQGCSRNNHRNRSGGGGIRGGGGFGTLVYNNNSR